MTMAGPELSELGPELSELGQTVLEGADEESGLDERVGRRAVVG
jgi:hypothetical protein